MSQAAVTPVPEALPRPGNRDASAVARHERAALLWPIVLLGLLAVTILGRYLALRMAGANPIVNGFAFGLALAGVATVGRFGARPIGARPSDSAEARPQLDASGIRRAGVGRSAVIGLAAGGALIGLALLGRVVTAPPPLPPVFAAGVFLPWALATVVVAFGEEAVVRGALFSSLTRVSGIWPAILVTSLVFALMHVPFYGWRVVPLDLGVGIWFAGLRLASRGILAPSIAHTIADLATWWL